MERRWKGGTEERGEGSPRQTPDTRQMVLVRVGVYHNDCPHTLTHICCPSVLETVTQSLPLFLPNTSSFLIVFSLTYKVSRSLAHRGWAESLELHQASDPSGESRNWAKLRVSLPLPWIPNPNTGQWDMQLHKCCVTLLCSLWKKIGQLINKVSTEAEILISNLLIMSIGQ